MSRIRERLAFDRQEAMLASPNNALYDNPNVALFRTAVDKGVLMPGYFPVNATGIVS
jgi:hypothetical protein